MKFEKLSEKDNQVMKRKEYWLSADHAGKETPSRHDLLSEVVKSVGSKEDATVIDKVFSDRGSATSRIKIFVYNDRKDIPKGKLDRQDRKVKAFLEKKKESEEKAQEAAAEAAEEAPKEEGKAATEGEAEKASEEGATEAPAEEEKKEEAPAEEKAEEVPDEEKSEDAEKKDE